ncbi:uncharacterized protein EI97DRAFT_31281 [Westerdykella ornata]|uniref:Uncharacterized protein n=1 Tax=Westerdykella ornata TaxID=318751 RepID=A0A6A6JY08_WESOR|nr:uncharacterized protein EI97DRAFT_31281 [Westerdykella ornata]KAF2281500.1 hypothetical protein EI97DRAFT_31281 [Westerdykella ornata]
MFRARTDRQSASPAPPAKPLCVHVATRVDSDLAAPQLPSLSLALSPPAIASLSSPYSSRILLFLIVVAFTPPLLPSLAVPPFMPFCSTAVSISEIESRPYATRRRLDRNRGRKYISLGQLGEKQASGHTWDDGEDPSLPH